MEKVQYTPMMMQYLAIKEKHPDTLILFRLGDFYELFFDDAKLVSKELQLTLTGRNAGQKERVPMCGVPYHAIKGYLARLVANGHKVGIVEQLEDPEEAVGIVDRDVIQIVTPGAFMDVEDQDNNFIVAIDETPLYYVVAYSDLSTGELAVFNVEHDRPSLLSAIDNLAAKEIVVTSSFDNSLSEDLTRSRSIVFSIEDNAQMEIENEYLLSDVQDLYQMQTITRLINYLKKTQKRQLDYLQPVVVQKAQSYLQIDAFSRLNLELTRTIRSEDKYGSLFWLLDETKTAMGARLLKKYINQPSYDLQEITARQSIVNDLIVNFLSREDLRKQLNEIYDLERLIARISYGNANGRDFLQLQTSLQTVPAIKKLITHLDNSTLTQIADSIDDFTDLCALLLEAISPDAPLTIREGGIFNRGYNQELDELIDIAHNSKRYIANLEAKERERTGIKTLKIGFNKVFGYYIEVTNSYLSQVKDEFGYIRKQTLTNGERFFTEELKEKETLILNADDRRKKLEYELFLALRNQVREETVKIQRLANHLARLDVLASFALVSARNHYVCPAFNFQRQISIIDGKHPVVDKVLKAKNYVANSVKMEPNEEVLLITGPNMGGKSTYMRELALIVIMAQIGCFVPAKSADIPLFDQIFTRIGASDDLVSGQSTFMVEMSETNFALRHATTNSLLLFDEIGRGTSTFDGMALAQSIIEYITDHIHAKTLFSTHYHELTKIADINQLVKNIHVEVEEHNQEVTFLYQVKPGPMNRSYGINVARLAHLPDQLLLRAETILEQLEKQKPVTVLASKKEHKNIEPAWINEVRTLDPLALTPMEALNFLFNLKKKM
ncbi:MAG: DNA mismatch repair protein MutS [Bacilli bacterium]|jgi:DNA mismatch repair protein MutS|nr:DNA mismatch repair protein MutS [Bacilli bacterium]MDD3389121.1 DNA mismatch repair protein MutS [Bacilli bacterium]MDD4344766.1 DNA mismatch repair protein MutS [Bacilli bacterium]MDD4520910.1 DNA mismatch repair protein MutS [Bacilli bacterium]MDY0399573.1 DNA mismatch repair protein MutS [Bacilli bacterium]